ncbi:MAG: extracellular solute-binding protein [Oscillospiraceae bacterium]|nr:extracellular solute-binding protein [Oscillospiraceae bacterium]
MRKKIPALFLMLCLTIMPFAGCGGSSTGQDTTAPAPTTQSQPSETAAQEAPSGGEEITLTIWDWDEAHLTHMTSLYRETNPNVSFETLIVMPTDFMQKLQSALAADMDVPDIILGELLYRGRLFELGILDDLSQTPYHVNRDEMFDFAVQLQTGPNGELLGVEQQICPSGFAYRRDLAREYLGTDDPDEIAALIPTWDAFIEQGRNVVQKSGGSVHIFPGISVMVYETLKGQKPSSYIEGNKINLTERYLPMFELAARMNQENILGNQERETPALNSGFADGTFLFFPCPPWAAKWNIAASDPDGSGNWGLTKAPEGGFTRGGTSVSIYSGSPNKEAAWDYVKFVYCDGDGVKEAFEQFGFMTGFKAPYQDANSYFFTIPGAFDEFFGGQNLAEYYINEISVETQGQVQTRHESTIHNALLAVVAQMANDKSITAQQAMELLKQETATMIPEAEII